jgi:hypothetical protein
MILKIQIPIPTNGAGKADLRIPNRLRLPCGARYHALAASVIFSIPSRAAVKLTMKKNTPFVVHLSSFGLYDEVLLLLADHSTIAWLISRFEELAQTPVESRSSAFVIGDGKPVQSDGQCIIFVDLNHQVKGSELVQESANTFRWMLSPSSADHYRELLSGILKAESPCHQYLDPDNAPSAPVVIVSLDEYEADAFRRPKV